MQKSLALACLLLAANACSAAEITHKAIRDNFGLILVRGDLTSNDGDAFQQVAYRYPNAGVLLESNGGSLLAGIRIGQIIRERNFSTGVAPDTRCASACALAWLGGTTRYMSAKSLIGFHAAYEMQNGVARETGAGNALVGAYLTRIGLPETAVLYMTVAAPTQIAWLTPAEARKIGVDLQVLETSPSGPTTAPADPPTTRSIASRADSAARADHYITGLDPNGDNWLALRDGPGPGASRLAKLPPDTPVHVIGHNGAWLNVRTEDGSIGWVSSRYVACCR